MADLNSQQIKVTQTKFVTDANGNILESIELRATLNPSENYVNALGSTDNASGENNTSYDAQVSHTTNEDDNNEQEVADVSFDNNETSEDNNVNNDVMNIDFTPQHTEFHNNEDNFSELDESVSNDEDTEEHNEANADNNEVVNSQNTYNENNTFANNSRFNNEGPVVYNDTSTNEDQVDDNAGDVNNNAQQVSDELLSANVDDENYNSITVDSSGETVHFNGYNTVDANHGLQATINNEVVNSHYNDTGFSTPKDGMATSNTTPHVVNENVALNDNVAFDDNAQTVSPMASPTSDVDLVNNTNDNPDANGGVVNQDIQLIDLTHGQGAGLISGSAMLVEQCANDFSSFDAIA